MKTMLVTLGFAITTALHAAPPPAEPVEIGTTPQFFIDDHLVDNRWALKQKREMVLRVFHAPVKHAGNPLLSGETGFCSVVKDEQSGMFRMWYQTHAWTGKGPEDESKTQYGIAYAESKDGVKWEKPKLGLHEWLGTKENNIVYKGHLWKPHLPRKGFQKWGSCSM